MKANLIILFIAIFLFSCSNKNKYEDSQEFKFDDFVATENLIGAVVEFDSLIMRPWDIFVKDSILITIEPAEEKLFHVFNLKTRKKITECITKGQGPKDMIHPEFMNSNGSNIVVFDHATSTIFEYEITDLVNNPDPTPVRRIKLEEEIYTCAQQIGNYIAGNSYWGKHQLNIFDMTGKKINAIIDYPTSSIPYSDMEKMDAYYMKFITNDSDKIVICYYMTDLIEIYNLDGILQKRLHGPEQFFVRVKERGGNISGTSLLKGTRDSYFQPRSAGDKFFVLYNGGDIYDPAHTSSCKRLFSFSWDGTPKIIYNLNDPIHNFAVDKKNKKIYGISETPEVHIVAYSY